MCRITGPVMEISLSKIINYKNAGEATIIIVL